MATATCLQWSVVFLTLWCMGHSQAGLAGRLERATPTPLQGLSLLDLPVFSRGDRPNMMDKTLGAIFSKVAFNQPNNSVSNASRAGNEVLEKNGAKWDVNKTQDSLLPKVPATSNATTTTTTTTTTPKTTVSTTETISPLVTTPSGPPSFSTSTVASTTEQPKLDFVPFDQWNKHYQVPGLRGPSRINTAKDPEPFYPPLAFTTPASTSTSRVTAPKTVPTTPSTTSATTTTHAPSSTTSTTPTPTTTATTAPRKPVPAPEAKVTKDGGKHAAWGVHVYATAALFTLLGVFALSSLLRLRSCARRLLPTTYCIVVQLLLLFVAITRTIHLLYDPYNARRLLPPALALALFNVTFPCLTAALAVLLLVVIKITRLQVLPAQLVKPALLATAVAFHFILSLSVDIVVGSVGGLFSLHLASQAYFVLWALALSLGYLAAFGPASRAAAVIQSDMMRSTLAALHINGAALPRRLPRPTLLRAIRVTLAAAVVGLLVAAFQLYGMFGVYGLPWRQQVVGAGTGGSSNHHAMAPVTMMTTDLPAPEWLRLQHKMKRRDAMMVDDDDSFEEMVIAPPAVMAATTIHKTKFRSNNNNNNNNALIWPVATEHFWPWWTYQLIARLLEFVMAMLMAYVASQPQRQHETVDVSKKGAAAFFKALPSSSLETLSSMCFGGAAMAAGLGKRPGGEHNVHPGSVHPPLSPVKSLASEEQFPAVCNSRSYCYAAAPTQPTLEHAAGRQGEAQLLYGSKRRSQRSSIPTPSTTNSASMLYNDQGFLRFRDNGDPLMQAYEELDQAHKQQLHQQLQQHQQEQLAQHHIYQELRPEMGFLPPPTPSASSFSGSSCTWSQAPSKILTRSSEPTDTPSTCTYEQLYSRGLAGCYEPNRYAGSRRNYESYGPAPQAQTPSKMGHGSIGFKKGEHILQGSLMENYVHMLLAAQAHRQFKLEKQESTDLDGDMEFDGDDGLEVRTDTGSFHDLYVSQCASTCSSESAANSFDLRLYPHAHSPNKRRPNLVSPDESKQSPFKRSHHNHHHHQPPPDNGELRLTLPTTNPKKSDYPLSLNLAPPSADGSAFVLIGGSVRKQNHHQQQHHSNKANMADISPDSAIVADIAQTPGTTPTDVIGKFSAKPPTSPLAQFFRFSSFSFGDKSYPAKKDKELMMTTPTMKTTMTTTRAYQDEEEEEERAGHHETTTTSTTTAAGKLLYRLKGSSASLNSASQYGYSPLVGSEDTLHQSCVSLRRATSENEVESLREKSHHKCDNSPPRHCSGCADNGDTLCPFLNAPRLRHPPAATDYWLSPELLRKHTLETGHGNGDVFLMLPASSGTEEGTQTSTSFEYGDRSFPTSLSDLEALQDGDNEVDMINSKYVHSNGGITFQHEAQYSSSEEESVV